MLDVDLPTVPQQRLLDHARIGKLIRQRARAIRLFSQQILDDPRVSPPQQLVQVTKLFVKLVIPLGANEHRLHQTTGSFPNGFAKPANTRIRSDPFAVLHTGIDKFARNPAIDIHSGNHQRPEKIAFPTFIYAKVRLEHFRRVHFFIAQLRFAEDFWFKLKLHELFHALALRKHLWPFFINRHA